MRSTLNGSIVPARFLVDTNILAYAFDARDSAKQIRAEMVLAALIASDRGSISVQILGEFYALMVRKRILPVAQAELAALEYSRSWTVFDVSVATVIEAIRGARRYQFGYFDALIWATAKLNGIPNILSEDEQDGQLIEGVRRLNPLLPSFNLDQLS